MKFSGACVLADSWVGIEEMRDGSNVLAVVASYLLTWARHTSAKPPPTYFFVGICQPKVRASHGFSIQLLMQVGDMAYRSWKQATKDEKSEEEKKK